MDSPTTWWVAYGKTSALGAESNRILLAANELPTQDEIQLRGLEPGTTYWYRVYAVNSDGTTISSLRSFRTSGTATIGTTTADTTPAITTTTVPATTPAAKTTAIVCRTARVVFQAKSLELASARVTATSPLTIKGKGLNAKTS